MKKILPNLLVLVTLMATSCGGDGTVRVSYWENGNVRSELRRADGKLDGCCRWYYATGVPMMEANYTMDVLNGESTRWHENGQVMVKAYYKDNQYDGVVEEYNVAGVLVKKENYENGVLNGLFTQWYDDGKLFVEGEYADGMMHGSWMMYYQDGSIGSRADYDMGTGVQYGYSPGGLYKNAMIHYKNNLRDGKEIRYAIDGSVEDVIIWREGECVGNILIDK